MRIRLSQLRQIIKEEVKRVIVETADDPVLEMENNYFCITIKNKKYEFMSDQIESLLNGNTRLSVNDLDYDENTGGCMLRCDVKTGPIKITVHNEEGEAVYNDDLPFDAARAALDTE